MSALRWLKSRTLWTGVVIILINGVPAAQDLIPVQYVPLINGILAILAIYFRVNPRVT